MTEKRLALIIATDQYEDKGLRQLISPAHDAEALAGVLKDPDIGGFEVKTLLNETSQRIRCEIEAFFKDRTSDNLLLLYFSCHGIKDEDGRLYYSTTDTDRKLLRATAIESGFVNDIMQRSRSRKQVLLLDCCYSGAFARGMITKADKKVITRNDFEGEGRGRVVLTASDAMQYSFEGDQVGGKGIPSVFTGNLVHGLKSGEADRDADGHITIDELYDYVHDRVVDATPEQRPAKWNFGVQGRIVIARNPNPIVKPVELPLELQESIKDTRLWVREGAVRELGRLLLGENKGLSLSALNTLKNMQNDDSRRVSVEATKILDEYEKLQLEKKAVSEEQPVIVNKGEGRPQKIEATEEKPVSVDKAHIERQEQMSAGQEKEVESSPQLPIKKEVKSISVSTKKRMLIWLLPATIVPFGVGMAFLVIFIIIPHSKNPTPYIDPEESSTTVTKVQEIPKTTLVTTTTPQQQQKAESASSAKVALKPTITTTTMPPKREQKQVSLRSKPTEGNLTVNEVKSMLQRYNFYCGEYDWSKEYCNPTGTGIQNNFEKKSKNGEVVINHTCGLAWQQSGSEEYYTTYKEAKMYIKKINTEKFAGYDDWRLPTLEEAMSLMKPTRNKDGLYIDPSFDKKQRYIWTSDTYSTLSVWVVNFGRGSCGNGGDNVFVRAVRSSTPEATPPPEVLPTNISFTKVAVEPTIITTTRPQKQVALRSKRKENNFTWDEVINMLKAKGFYDSAWNKSAEGFQNDFEIQLEGKIVYDRASGLMWQQSGSDEYLYYEKAKKYVDRLNQDKYAGYSDWRLPTLEEAMSLTEPTQMNGDLYIDPKFDKQQQWIWTSDLFSASAAWGVYFGYWSDGNCGGYDFDCNDLYVRAVR